MKSIIATIALLFTVSANAQIVSGIIGGAIGATAGSSRTGSSGTVVASQEGRSALVCCTSVSVNYQMCVDVRTADPSARGETMTPAAFAAMYGWTKVHSVGFLQSSSGTCAKIIIEVSK